MLITLKIEDQSIHKELKIDHLYCIQTKKEEIKWKIEYMCNELLGNKEFETKYLQKYKENN